MKLIKSGLLFASAYSYRTSLILMIRGVLFFIIFRVLETKLQKKKYTERKSNGK